MSGRQGLMLPLDLRLDDGVRLAYATAEIAALEGDAVVFRARQPNLVAAFETDRTLSVQRPAQVHKEEGLQVVRLPADLLHDHNVAVRWS